MCAELEGHPDNAAPAAFGGFTIARAGRLFSALSGRSRTWALLCSFPISRCPRRTRAKCFRKRSPLGDAVVSVSNACAIAGAFASRDYEKLAGCFEDRLHQPYREKLGSVPFAGDRRGNQGGRPRGMAQRFGIHRCLSHAGKGGAGGRCDARGVRTLRRAGCDDTCGQYGRADLSSELINAALAGRSRDVCDRRHSRTSIRAARRRAPLDPAWVGGDLRSSCRFALPCTQSPTSARARWAVLSLAWATLRWAERERRRWWKCLPGPCRPGGAVWRF